MDKMQSEKIPIADSVKTDTANLTVHWKNRKLITRKVNHSDS